MPACERGLAALERQGDQESSGSFLPPWRTRGEFLGLREGIGPCMKGGIHLWTCKPTMRKGVRILKPRRAMGLILLAGALIAPGCGHRRHALPQESLYDPGPLKAMDSELKVRAGDRAPDFTLQAVSGKRISLGQYRGKKNVVLSFVPAAWTPHCSEQWPGYDIVKDAFDEGDAVLLGISVDNLPTLHAWTRQMGGVWFEVLSDFWPHGAVAETYGVLRGDGLSERALFFIDKDGIIRGILVLDVNQTPGFEACADELKKLGEPGGQE